MKTEISKWKWTFNLNALFPNFHFNATFWGWIIQKDHGKQSKFWAWLRFDIKLRIIPQWISFLSWLKIINYSIHLLFVNVNSPEMSVLIFAPLMMMTMMVGGGEEKQTSYRLYIGWKTNQTCRPSWYFCCCGLSVRNNRIFWVVASQIDFQSWDVRFFCIENHRQNCMRCKSFDEPCVCLIYQREQCHKKKTKVFTLVKCVNRAPVVLFKLFTPFDIIPIFNVFFGEFFSRNVFSESFAQ